VSHSQSQSPAPRTGPVAVLYASTNTGTSLSCCAAIPLPAPVCVCACPSAYACAAALHDQVPLPVIVCTSLCRNTSTCALPLARAPRPWGFQSPKGWSRPSWVCLRLLPFNHPSMHQQQQLLVSTEQHDWSVAPALKDGSGACGVKSGVPVNAPHYYQSRQQKHQH
jgi:hypothetical protein